MSRKKNHIKGSKADRAFDIINIILMIIVLVIIVYPLYFVIVASISEPYEVAKGNVTLYPIGFTLAAYENVFNYDEIWIGYRNTIFYTAFGILLSLFLTLTSAYVLSKKHFTCRKFFTWYFLITMYFGGGLIPTYLLVRDLDLLDKAYTLIIIGSFSVFQYDYHADVFRIYDSPSHSMSPRKLTARVKYGCLSALLCLFRVQLLR